MKYLVTWIESYEYNREIEANSEDEAIDKMSENCGTEEEFTGWKKQIMNKHGQKNTKKKRKKNNILPKWQSGPGIFRKYGVGKDLGRPLSLDIYSPAY